MPMNKQESEFLIAEYTESLAIIRSIEERRATFLNFYSVLTAGIYVVVFGILGSKQIDVQYRYLVVYVLLSNSIVAGAAITYVLKSERSANVRYKVRVNRIRDMFLQTSEIPVVFEYLKSETHNPSGVGRTLKGIFGLIAVQIVASLVMAMAIWFYLEPSTKTESPAKIGSAISAPAILNSGLS